MQTTMQAEAIFSGIRVSGSREISAFLFDVDGVLADTAGLHREAWGRVAREEGLPFDERCAEALRGLSREASLRRILNDREVPRAKLDELMDRKNSYYVESLAGLGACDVLPGAARLLAEIREHDLKAAAVSASRNARRVLQQIRLLDAFDALVDGEQSTGGNRYLSAAGIMGVRPGACVVVEDSLAGIQLAQTAGMRTIALGPLHSQINADLRFASLEKLSIRGLLEDFQRLARNSTLLSAGKM